MSEYTPSMWSDIDAAIEHAERCRRRQDLAPLFKAVSDTLDEYLSRVHGIQASWAHPGEFVRWLTEHGILPVDAGELAAYGRSIVEAGEREAEQIVALTERAEAAERRAEQPAPCVWRPQDTGDWDYWDAACGGAFSFEDGDPDTNQYAYCPRCGHPILLVARTESIDVEDGPEAVTAALASPPEEAP